MTTVILDNEAVRALLDRRHPKHMRVSEHIRSITDRRLRRSPLRTIAPTAVRVEAGWDRRSPRDARANGYAIDDHALDGRIADEAAAIVAEHRVGVADAHIGALCRELAERTGERVVVLTSDPVGIERVTAPTRVVAIRI